MTRKLDKITCAYETPVFMKNIPEDLRPHLKPNGTDPSKNGGIPQTLIEWGNYMFDYHARINYLYTNQDQDFQYKLIESLEPNEFYIYPISIGRGEYFDMLRDTGFDCVHPKVLEDVRNNRALIVLLQQHEGHSGIPDYGSNDYCILQSWIECHDLPGQNVVYIHGNLRGAELAKLAGCTARVENVSVFEHWIHHNLQEKPLPFMPHPETPLYMCLNRRARPHRRYLLDQLYCHNLHEKGIVSYHIEDMEFFKYYINNFESPSVEYFQNNPRREVDVSLDINQANNLNPEFHSQTFLHLNTETLHDNRGIFFSEKIFKPIIAGQPFLLLGNPGSLKMLHNMGYKTFSDWWDESYDSDTNWHSRTDTVVQILKHLDTLGLDRLVEMRQEMQPVLQHNIDTFRERYQRYFPTHCQPLIDIINRNMERLKTL